ncbi:hypothetical protein G210_3901 [Candida maltosa Xu316]|uniref:Uncharacterized protein n=1 Tax=Candida maltosa (strain Xu316) TaxID=1245528 RepID=M3JU46_CANMX|nr:hypothetical protein G210_3901 [Candida maltosa Xu316]
MDADGFRKLAQLPIDVLDIIISYIPKHCLPRLLYNPAIADRVAAHILSNVRLMPLRKGSGIGHTCEYHNYTDVNIGLDDLLDGISKWNIYPKQVHFGSFDLFTKALKQCPEVLEKVGKVNCSFTFTKARKVKVINLNIKNINYGEINLIDFKDYFKKYSDRLPPRVENLKLDRSNVETFQFENLKALNIQQPSPITASDMVTIPDTLESLTCHIHAHGLVKFPSNLKTLDVDVCMSPYDFKLGELKHLNTLTLTAYSILRADQIGLSAPNLRKLTIEGCLGLYKYGEIKKFSSLESLIISAAPYPMDLFDERSLPNLKKFSYTGTNSGIFDDEVSFYRAASDFKIKCPPNLTELLIMQSSFLKINLAKSKFPKTLRTLMLLDVCFINFELTLNESIEIVRIYSDEVEFTNSIRFPPNMKRLDLIAKKLYLENFDFLNHLPDNFENLRLISKSPTRPMRESNKITTWGKSMKTLEIKQFNLTNSDLEILNLKESKLENIIFYKGNIGKLDPDLFPETVKRLSLERMGITDLPRSFLRLKNLRSLTLNRNYFPRKLPPIKMPNLEELYIKHCDLRYISPFLISWINGENSIDPASNRSVFHVDAMDNFHLVPKDIKRVMNKTNRLILWIITLNPELLSYNVSHLYCIEPEEYSGPSDTDYSSMYESDGDDHDNSSSMNYSDQNDSDFEGRHHYHYHHHSFDEDEDEDEDESDWELDGDSDDEEMADESDRPMFDADFSDDSETYSDDD